MMATKIENMSFSYGNISVLDQINFTLNAGDYTILTGENGCGKSTFLKLLLGELNPQQGTVSLFGLPVCTSVFRRFHIGYVPQNSISKNQNFPATVKVKDCQAEQVKNEYPMIIVMNGTMPRDAS